MKVVCLVENFAPFLSILSRTIPTHVQVPILSNILFEAKDSTFFVYATDLDFGFRGRIPAKIEEEGSITIPGKQFIEVMQSLPADKVRFEKEKETFFIYARENKITFQTITGEEFPRIVNEKGDRKVSFTGEEFRSIFSRLTFAVATDSSRPQLSGVFFAKRGEEIDFVATDGFRLSVKSVKKNIFKEEQGGIIVGARLINEALSLKSSETLDMYIGQGGSQVLFEAGDFLFSGRLIEGDFPAYYKVIPPSYKTRVVVNFEEFLSAVRLSSVFARDNANIVRLFVGDRGIRMSAKSQGVGEGEAVVEAQREGEDVEIAFNVRFLMDFLKAVEGEKIVMEFNSGLEPGVFRVDEDKSFLHVIMPVRVQE